MMKTNTPVAVATASRERGHPAPCAHRWVQTSCLTGVMAGAWPGSNAREGVGDGDSSAVCPSCPHRVGVFLGSGGTAGDFVVAPGWGS